MAKDHGGESEKARCQGTDRTDEVLACKSDELESLSHWALLHAQQWASVSGCCLVGSSRSLGRGHQGAGLRYVKWSARLMVEATVTVTAVTRS